MIKYLLYTRVANDFAPRMVLISDDYSGIFVYVKSYMCTQEYIALRKIQKSIFYIGYAYIGVQK